MRYGMAKSMILCFQASSETRMANCFDHRFWLLNTVVTVKQAVKGLEESYSIEKPDPAIFLQLHYKTLQKSFRRIFSA
jgi:hypothetical protein